MKKFKEWIKIKEANDDLSLDMDMDLDLEPNAPKTMPTKINQPAKIQSQQSQPINKPSGTIQLGKGTNFKFLEGKVDKAQKMFWKIELVYETKDPSFKNFIGTKNHPVIVNLSSLEMPIKQGLFGSAKKFGDLPAKLSISNNRTLLHSNPQEGSTIIRINDISIDYTDKELAPRRDMLSKYFTAMGIITDRAFGQVSISMKM